MVIVGTSLAQHLMFFKSSRLDNYQATNSSIDLSSRKTI